MVDDARQSIYEGAPIAADRASGVNDNMFDAHYHKFYEIYYLESGQRYQLIDEKLYMVGPGQFLLFAPGVPHYSYGEENVPFCRLLVYFKEEEILSEGLKQQLSKMSGIYQLPQRINQRFYGLMNQLYNEVQNHKSCYKESSRSILNELLILFLRNNEPKKQKVEKSQIEDIIVYMNTHYTQTCTLEQLAEKFYMSPFYLCRVFKAYTHTTVVQYMHTIRIMKALQLLSSTEKSITEICFEVGFNNLTHFGRTFKKVTGVTPREWKKQTDNQNPKLSY